MTASTAADDGNGEPLGFKAGLRAEVLSGERVYLFSERGVTTLRGPHMGALAPLLDGTRDLHALKRDAPADLAPGTVESMIGRLRDAGLVGARSAVPGPDPGLEDIYWEAAGLEPHTAAAGLASDRVQPVAVGGTDARAAARTLAATGVHTAEILAHTAADMPALDADATLSVVLCDDYLNAALEDVDAAHRSAGRPWLLARPAGTRLWIGPVFTPGQGGACWHCLAHRLRMHRQDELSAWRDLGGRHPVAPPTAALPALTAAALNLVSLEAAKWVAGYRDAHQRSVWTMDSVTLRGEEHELRARPQCRNCGDPALMRAQARRPVTLRVRPAADDTGYRSRPAQDVLDDFGHLVSPVTGLVKGLRRVPGTPTGSFAYHSGPNAAADEREAGGLRSAARAENGGKGTTDLHARVSALCEALERHSGSWHGDEQVVRGSYAKLADRAVHPDACMLYDSRQYRDRHRWNAEHGAFQYVCDPFDDHRPLNWTPVWSLTGERFRLLPTAMLYFGAPGEPEWTPVQADSNGCAAGTSLEDAVLQAALELVERDAVALWWYNRTRQPAVDLDAFADPWVERMRASFAALGRQLWVLDVTSDLDVPAMAAVHRRIEGGPERVMFGFGAHPDAYVALRRAVAEACQLLPHCQDPAAWEDPDAAAWLDGPGTRGAPHLLPAAHLRMTVPPDRGVQPCDDLAAQVRRLRDRFAERGMEMLVLDQTRPDIGLPVAKVVAPGMRGFWSRFAPGRMFDVPVKLGRLSKPTPYGKLNPDLIFL
ncbi:TOMM precursor leader peptide-binding protein [Streptomonospora litoralis]|uniref:YcaO-like family protein n=1 Tax=Streptomonospora litoralis TaxID=2498135 RepID=A0A4P6Q441_9ACTN|nr:TOMM precursor leader peptide-binding protein [Streptomonospora litoralis]QBI55456.1 YcaO-like family protein [Streptomonospora litoralis]